MTAKPRLFIFTGAHDFTGALVAAYREALLLRDCADVTLVLSSRACVGSEHLPGVDLLRLPLATAQKDWRSLLAYPFQLLHAGRALRRALRARDCHRLQVNDYYLMEGAVARLFGYRGRIVTWVRIDPSKFGGRAAWLWLRIARAVSSDIIAVSRFVAGLLPPDMRARVVYDAVPPERPAPRLANQAAAHRFVFIGNYIQGKGQDVAIAAFARIAADFPAASLHFYGADLGLAKNRDFLARLKELAESGPAPHRIHFGGFVDDTRTVLAGALAALNCSSSESFSLTCLEASAGGLPVIATRCGGPEEIIEQGVTGLLVPVGDVGAVAAAMRLLLDNPAEAAAMGRRGAELVRDRFSAQRLRRSLVTLFDFPDDPAAA